MLDCARAVLIGLGRGSLGTTPTSQSTIWRARRASTARRWRKRAESPADVMPSAADIKCSALRIVEVW